MVSFSHQHPHQLIHTVWSHELDALRIPFNRARALAQQYGVDQLLLPLFDHSVGPNQSENVPVSTEARPPISSPSAIPPDPTEPNHLINHHLTLDQSHLQQLPKRDRLSTSTYSTADERLSEPGPSKRSRFNTPSHQSNASDHTAISRPDPNRTFNSSIATFATPNPQTQHHPSTYEPTPGPSTLPPISLPRMRSFNPAPALTHGDLTHPLRQKHVHALLSVFANASEGGELPATQLAPEFATDLNHALVDPDLDIDTPIDEHAHTALHWASALARIGLVRDLLKFGADPHLGNKVGETPLIRATLVTSNFEHSCFDQLLDLLHPSLATTDGMNRSVLHHICLTASIKGRTESSRYYMECIFEWIVKRHDGRFDKDFIDAVDANGDTALNIAARVGNKHLLQMLLDVGASQTIANKLGLDPTDFGVEAGVEFISLYPAHFEIFETCYIGLFLLHMTDGLKFGYTQPPSLTDAVAHDQPTTAAHLEPPPPPLQRPRPPREVIASMTNLLGSLTSDFDEEIRSRSTALEGVRSQLKMASRELTEQRRQLEEYKHELDGVSLVELRLKKLRKAIAEEDRFDWTGRSEVDGSAGRAGKAFEYRGVGSTILGLSSDQIGLELDPDPPVPDIDTPGSLIYLRRLQSWYRRALDLMRERIRMTKGCDLAQEAKYLKIISTFIGAQHLPGPSTIPRKLLQPVPPPSSHYHLKSPSGPEQKASTSTEPSQQGTLNPIDFELLNQLMVAIESDGPNLDLHRVAGFMSRVNAGLV